ncbi:hypothetical protein CDO73_08445 [Saccharibacillus sp. O23]|uniref:DUF6612 family protein n=1 Tax=Saccharibacillus sp. O23 TaxID=2009338 RepID=UPI000B4E3237|nr:DUF6612 family protein [Saccharibacillus sp. O23]OWR31155.1 hypothetical protein CDO73_08445 [Saccharibacillus sp. O23]
MYSAKSNRNRHYLANTLKASALSLLLLTAACTSDSGTAKESGNDAKPSGETTESAAKVYDTALEQAKALESYTIASKTNLTAEQAAAEGAEAAEPVETAIDIAGDVIAKPETQYGLKIDTLSQGQQSSTELYAVGDQLHVKNGSGAWSTQNLGESEEALAIATDMLDPAPLLEDLNGYKDSLKVSEDDKAYTLTLEASGAEAGKLIESALGTQMGDASQTSGLLKSGSEGTVSYSLVIDKATHQLNSSSVKVDTTLDVNKQSVHVTANSDYAYSKQNAVGEIAVPAEATAAE